jgi:copper chaperone CopZ
MTKTLGMLGILVAASALSIYGLYVPGETPARRSTAFAEVAAAAAVRTAPTPPAAVPATTTIVTLRIAGMTCGGCVIGTRTVLARLPGVKQADVSYEKGTAVVTYDPAKVTIAQMIAAIKTLNYTATAVAG